ncbi:MAG: nucleotidyltransferase family protein [Acidimicrobiales bacterium]|nr:nucleotidyltransferase family protein [Acidimicrobiales bacterium]
MTVCGVVLAAGAGSRFEASGGDGPKPLATVDGIALVDRALAVVVAAGFDEVVLVDGSTNLSDREAPGVTVLHNAAWSEGIATSLQVAVAHARAVGHEAIVVGLADQPGITTDAWRAVAAALPEPPVAVATYGERRGNPVRLAASVWDLLPTTGDEGARSLMRERADLVREVPCTGEPWDIDTVEDLERWS